jgi:hypothetical protein
MRISDIDKAIRSVSSVHKENMEKVGRADRGLLIALHILNRVRQKLEAKHGRPNR